MMNKERLLKAAQACRETPEPKYFDMGIFGHPGVVCGSPGCVLGNYAFRTDLQKAFKLRDGNIYRMNAQLPVPDGTEDSNLWYTAPVVLSHFDIDESQAYELFGGSGCGNAKTHLQAAAYIEMFVEQNA